MSDDCMSFWKPGQSSALVDKLTAIESCGCVVLSFLAFLSFLVANACTYLEADLLRASASFALRSVFPSGDALPVMSTPLSMKLSLRKDFNRLSNSAVAFLLTMPLCLCLKPALTL